jgi:hypothetical protein
VSGVGTAAAASRQGQGRAMAAGGRRWRAGERGGAAGWASVPGGKRGGRRERRRWQARGGGESGACGGGVRFFFNTLGAAGR